MINGLVALKQNLLITFAFSCTWRPIFISAFPRKTPGSVTRDTVPRATVTPITTTFQRGKPCGTTCQLDAWTGTLGWWLSHVGSHGMKSQSSCKRVLAVHVVEGRGASFVFPEQNRDKTPMTPLWLRGTLHGASATAAPHHPVWLH